MIFANSDPRLVRLFIRWAGRFLDAGPDRLTAKLNIHDGQDDGQLRRHWAEETSIPIEQFTKSHVKREGTGHRKNVLYHGTISVRVRRSGADLERILGWIEGLAEMPAMGALSCAALAGR